MKQTVVNHKHVFLYIFFTPYTNQADETRGVFRVYRESDCFSFPPLSNFISLCEKTLEVFDTETVKGTQVESYLNVLCLYCV